MPPHNADINQRASNIVDFIIRRQRPTFSYIVIVFFAVLLLCVTLAVVNLDKVSLIVSLFIALALLCTYMILMLQRTRDMLLTTEFQNALFASALQYDRTFLLIIKNNGNIVYMDRGFQKIFPHFVKQGMLSLAKFLEHSKAEQASMEKIFSAIEHGVGNRVVCTLHDAEGHAHKEVVSLEPIHRPSGFFVVHARTFVEPRNDSSANAGANTDILSHSNLSSFAEMMDRMDIGMYALDAKGSVIHANTTLERWLEYQDNEISHGNFTYSDIIFSGGNTPDIGPDQAFEKEVSLKTNGGTITSAQVNQKIIRSDHGGIVGAVAIVTMSSQLTFFRH